MTVAVLIFMYPNGSKYWIFRFYLNNKQTYWDFGQYPDISLKDARKKRALQSKLVKQGIHPRDHWNKQKEDNSTQCK